MAMGQQGKEEKGLTLRWCQRGKVVDVGGPRWRSPRAAVEQGRRRRKRREGEREKFGRRGKMREERERRELSVLGEVNSANSVE